MDGDQSQCKQREGSQFKIRKKKDNEKLGRIQKRVPEVIRDLKVKPHEEQLREQGNVYSREKKIRKLEDDHFYIFKI